MFRAEHSAVLYMRLGTHVSHVCHEEEVQLPVQTHAQIRSWFWPMILFVFCFNIWPQFMSLGRLVCSFLEGRRKGRREGGCKAREECWRRGGGMRDGGRNSLKSQSEVWVAADRQIAAERARQIGKVIQVRAVKLKEILNSLKFYRDVRRTFGDFLFPQILDFWGIFFYSLGFLFLFFCL